MIGNLKFGNIESQNYNAMFSDSFLFEMAEPDFDTYSIDGRNGDLHIDNNRKKNFSYTIQGVIPSAYLTNYLPLRSELLNCEGYMDIKSYMHTEYYRKGKIQSISNITSSPEKDIVTFGVKVTFRPELYLTNGETILTFSASGLLTNPTPCESKPLLRVYGKGTITVGTTVIKVNTAGTSYIDIDTDTMQAYEGDLNRNSYITVTEWGHLTSGENTVTLGSGITKVEVTPRWCYL